MKITARQITDWAKKREAQAILPELMRRLIHASDKIGAIDMPAGDAINTPGFDGVVEAGEGNAWLPPGKSVWEFSVAQQVKSKADKDFNKRLSSADTDTTYVAVTARSYPKGKSKWLADLPDNKWKDVRFYDAGDLEQWLEQTPSVSIWFAEQLGLAGFGIESPERYWEQWRTHCNPAITGEVFLVGRENAQEDLVKKANKRMGTGEVMSVIADSSEEALAFCAVILSNAEGFRDRTAIVTDDAGWHFAETNEKIEIVVAVNATPRRLADRLVIIPQGRGQGHQASIGQTDDCDVSLSRLDHKTFLGALEVLGEKRYSEEEQDRKYGRSWTVFRRLNSTMPNRRKPSWVDSSATPVLAALSLIPAWVENKEADIGFVATVAGMDYESVQRELQRIAELDDAPIVRLDGVWMVKSPLELTYLMGSQITGSQIERFLESAQTILSNHDPKLDLPVDERLAAAPFQNSEIFRETLAESLARLVELRDRVPNLEDYQIEAVIRSIFKNADGETWLSIQKLLPLLSEAAPEEFLRAIESSLEDDKNVLRLFQESEKESGFGAMGGACWHSGLLWALETIAWSPEYCPRVALILAQLDGQPTGQWSNDPFESLLSLFRSWLPQTHLNVGQRIDLLEKVVSSCPDIAPRLLGGICRTGSYFVSFNHKPKWRDFGGDYSGRVTNAEKNQMWIAALKMFIALEGLTAEDVADLLDKALYVENELGQEILSTAMKFAEASSARGKAKIRAALRIILWRGTPLRNGKTKFPSHSILSDFEKFYDDLEGKIDDPVERFAWLFDHDARHRPMETGMENDWRKNEEELHRQRIAALREIYNAHGLAGIERLASDAPDKMHFIPSPLFQIGLSQQDISQWLLKLFRDGDTGSWQQNLVFSVLSWAARNDSGEVSLEILMDAVLDTLSDAEKVCFLLLAPEIKCVFDQVQNLSQKQQADYWAACRGEHARNFTEDAPFASTKLLEAGRPFAAFHKISLIAEEIDIQLLWKIISALPSSTENNVQFPSLDYDLAQAIARLEQSLEIDRDELVMVELRLHPIFRFDGKSNLPLLYSSVTTSPDLFVGLIEAVFRPRSERGKPKKEATATEQSLAKIAFDILHHASIPPGLDGDTIDAQKLTDFVNNARQKCKNLDRLEACDTYIGQMLAHSPNDEDDDVFPDKAARDLLEYASEDMRDGFAVGVANKRGVYCGNGAEEERQLAAQYERYADHLNTSHPLLAATMRKISREYSRQAKQSDMEASLSREGHLFGPH